MADDETPLGAQVDMLRVFALANEIMPIVVGRNIAETALAFAMILGRAESSRKPYPQPTELGLVMMNEITRWADPGHAARAETSSTAIIAGLKP